MDKTAVVVIERLMRHLHYKKYVKRVKRLMVHDEENVCRDEAAVEKKALAHRRDNREG